MKVDEFAEKCKQGKGNVSYSQFDLKKVERDTGYINQIPFADGIKMTADYIRGEA